MSTALHRFPRTGCRQGAQSGFTIIELMVVITVAAILMAVAVPSFRDLIVGQRVKTAAFTLTSAVVFTRSEAIKRNTDVVLLANSGGWQNGWSVKVGTTVLSQQEAFSDDVAIASVPSKVTATQITYQSSGRLGAAVDDLQVADTAGGHARCISFDLSGLPKSRMGGC